MMQIAVIGGGLMGAGIAQVFAGAGYPVALFEPNNDARSTVHDRIRDSLTQLGTDLSAANLVKTYDVMDQAVASADFVFEAAPEKLQLKKSIFADLIRFAPRHAILASNTSVIPITRIAFGLDTAERIVGTHWWNPAFLVPLVEVVQAAGTSIETINAMMRLLTDVGKRPAHVKKDLPGFVANRLQHALWREAIAMVAEGICDAATLDACVKNSFGRRLPVLGPLENADLVGLDLTLDIHKTMIPELDRHALPHQYLVDQVEAGNLGFKSGIGFRAWTEQEMQTLRTQLAEHLVEMQHKDDAR